MEEYAEYASYKLMAVVDMIHVKPLFDDISGIIGDEAPMERLNLVFRQRFLAVPACTAYAQGLTNDLLYCLNHRDMEAVGRCFSLCWIIVGSGCSSEWAWSHTCRLKQAKSKPGGAVGPYGI